MFFLSIKDNYEPVGYITTPSAVTVLQWMATVCNYIPLCVYLCLSCLSSHMYQQDQLENLKLLVCCEDGAMLEVNAPQKDLYDTSKTYLLEPLQFTCRHFSSVKDKIKVMCYTTSSLSLLVYTCREPRKKQQGMQRGNVRRRNERPD